ncbi:MAG: hypothetical protein EAZ97_02305, partial [Bacteroidetes bacterium]
MLRFHNKVKKYIFNQELLLLNKQVFTIYFLYKIKINLIFIFINILYEFCKHLFGLFIRGIYFFYANIFSMNWRDLRLLYKQAIAFSIILLGAIG